MDTFPDMRSYGGADAYLRQCPSRAVLDVLANKWTTLVLPALMDGPMRFGQLRRRLDGITQKSLTQALRNLERDGMLTRTMYPTIPPRVEYELTDLGRSASGLLRQLRVWAEDNMEDVMHARAVYELRADQEPEPVSA